MTSNSYQLWFGSVTGHELCGTNWQHSYQQQWQLISNFPTLGSATYCAIYPRQTPSACIQISPPHGLYPLPNVQARTGRSLALSGMRSQGSAQMFWTAQKQPTCSGGKTPFTPQCPYHLLARTPCHPQWYTLPSDRSWTTTSLTTSLLTANMLRLGPTLPRPTIHHLGKGNWRPPPPPTQLRMSNNGHVAKNCMGLYIIYLALKKHALPPGPWCYEPPGLSTSSPHHVRNGRSASPNDTGSSFQATTPGNARSATSNTPKMARTQYALHLTTT